MSAAAIVFLFIGVACELGCCLGIIASRNVYARLHFIGPATTVGPASIALAVVISGGLSQAGMKAILIALILLVTSPVLTHATARAAYRAEREREGDEGRSVKRKGPGKDDGH